MDMFFTFMLGVIFVISLYLVISYLKGRKADPKAVKRTFRNMVLSAYANKCLFPHLRILYHSLAEGDLGASRGYITGFTQYALGITNKKGEFSKYYVAVCVRSRVDLFMRRIPMISAIYFYFNKPEIYIIPEGVCTNPDVSDHLRVKGGYFNLIMPRLYVWDAHREYFVSEPLVELVITERFADFVDWFGGALEDAVKSNPKVAIYSQMNKKRLSVSERAKGLFKSREATNNEETEITD